MFCWKYLETPDYKFASKLLVFLNIEKQYFMPGYIIFLYNTLSLVWCGVLLLSLSWVSQISAMSIDYIQKKAVWIDDNPSLTAWKTGTVGELQLSLFYTVHSMGVQWGIVWIFSQISSNFGINFSSQCCLSAVTSFSVLSYRQWIGCDPGIVSMSMSNSNH